MDLKAKYLAAVEEVRLKALALEQKKRELSREDDEVWQFAKDLGIRIQYGYDHYGQRDPEKWHGLDEEWIEDNSLCWTESGCSGG